MHSNSWKAKKKLKIIGGVGGNNQVRLRPNVRSPSIPNHVDVIKSMRKKGKKKKKEVGTTKVRSTFDEVFVLWNLISFCSSSQCSFLMSAGENQTGSTWVKIRPPPIKTVQFYKTLLKIKLKIKVKKIYILICTIRNLFKNLSLQIW